MLKRKPRAPRRRPISLALQGGGAHGAFQWGVLDRLLEDDRLDIRAVTASSAGAMNAAALISGLHADGAVGARRQLDLLWREVNLSGGRNVFGDSSIWSAALTPGWLKDSSLWRSAENAAMSMSPYQFNPFNLNPLKRVLDTAIDFDAVRASSIQLFVAATAVRHGRARLFKTSEITDQVLLASACLPHLFQAVEIDGEPYWDGGYLANPALWPLFYADTPDDILLLPLNPFVREETPRAAGDIMDRLNEIVFNAPLVAELRAVAFVQDMIADGRLKRTGEDRYRSLMLHAIEPGPWLGALSLSSKFNTEWTFLNDLKARGREAAGEWLEQCFADVGRRSSIDIKARFLA
ncbi:MAG: patatin-like phospholipase family protein [Phenylobacterium sp.]|uniref:patatin-like phospholipase family protein n=1 Tax=Brevundimonas sp. TaxID=1871086 RepID=UPI002737E558|nr:patatin-like phospholipase family protein [Brevundimonas sp.]MDP3800632.1 patatin-like phospholipase family protein [Brevundimonas sp.]MDZ4370056.1 patatin-like phospholipase family protein [Phenylobacterium sp.]